MFCHNCGKDCGDFKFCPHCGTQVKIDEAKTAVEAVWAVGKPCPQCGGTEVSNGRCAFCGVQLFEVERQEQKIIEIELPKPPIGIYRIADDYMQLGDYGFRIFKKFLNNEVTDFSMAYRDIADVKFEYGKTLNPGFLSIKSKQNRHIPFPATFTSKMYDKSTFFVHKRNNDEFYRLYLYFKQCADIINAAEE